MQSLVLERAISSLDSPARRSGRRSHRSEPFLIGVAGGTASGKTTVCDLIIQRLHEQSVVMLAQVGSPGRQLCALPPVRGGLGVARQAGRQADRRGCSGPWCRRTRCTCRWRRRPNQVRFPV